MDLGNMALGFWCVASAIVVPALGVWHLWKNWGKDGGSGPHRVEVVPNEKGAGWMCGTRVDEFTIFIIPGLIYTLWRMSSTKKVCGRCGSPNIYR